MCVFSLTKLNGTKVVYKIVKNIIIYRLNTKIRLTMLFKWFWTIFSLDAPDRLPFEAVREMIDSVSNRHVFIWQR